MQSNSLFWLIFFTRNLAEFPKILAIAVDSLLISCDDQESDVRLVAGECLNKLIKVSFIYVSYTAAESYSEDLFNL